MSQYLTWCPSLALCSSLGRRCLGTSRSLLGQCIRELEWIYNVLFSCWQRRENCSKEEYVTWDCMNLNRPIFSLVFFWTVFWPTPTPLNWKFVWNVPSTIPCYGWGPSVKLHTSEYCGYNEIPLSFSNTIVRIQPHSNFTHTVFKTPTSPSQIRQPLLATWGKFGGLQITQISCGASKPLFKPKLIFLISGGDEVILECSNVHCCVGDFLSIDSRLLISWE